MPLFSSRFRNKVLQMTYKPGSASKKKFSPVKTISDIEKAFDEGIESLLFEEEKEDDKEKKDGEKAADKEKSDKKEE